MSKWGRMLTAMLLTAALCLGAAAGYAQGVLTLPTAVKEIESEAFLGLKYVTEVVLPDGVETIGERAFAESSIVRINLPESVTSIADNAFADCVLTIYGESGSYAQTYAKENGIPFVSADDAFFNYRIVNGSARVTGYTGDKKNVVIPDMLGGYPVTMLERTFDDNDEIETVVLPSTLKTLGGYVFWGCENLVSVEFNSDVESIGEYAFFQCRVLEDFVLPASVKSIGTAAFAGCRRLTKLPFEEGVEKIGSRAFEEAWGFTEIEIPACVTTIGSSAFSIGQYLKKVVIPATVTSIGAKAFSGCHREFTIYGDAGSYAQTYAEANSLRFVALNGESPDEEERPNEFTYALSEMGTFITGYTGTAAEIVIPATIDGQKITGVWFGAFKNNTTLRSVTLPEGLTTIMSSAFEGCTALESVTIPQSMQAIESGAFSGCTALEEIDLSANATLGESVFYGCENLDSVTLPANLTEIPAYTFYGCGFLINAPIPAGVTEIGEYAFFECTNLRGVELPAGLVALGEHVFDNCEMLDEIVLPEALETLGSYAFYSCGSLKSVQFNSDIEEIGEFTFFRCGNLTDVQLPASVKSIGMKAFEGCNGLKALPFGEGVETIGERAFADCYYIEEIEIPSSVTSIGPWAFCFNYDLTKATIPATVTEIGENAFWGCNEVTIYGYTGSAAHSYAEGNGIPFIALDGGNGSQEEGGYTYTVTEGKATITKYAGGNAEVVIPATLGGKPVTAIGAGAFKNDAILKSVTIPEGVTAIGDEAFAGCTALYGVDLPVSLETIGAHAFDGCSSLNFVEFEKNVSVVGEDAFANCGENISFCAYPNTAPAEYADTHGIFYEYNFDEYYDGDYVYNIMGEMAAIVGYTGRDAQLSIPAMLGGYPVTMIAPNTFRSRLDITSVVFPEGLSLIATNAFSNCKNLTSISLPSTLIEFYGSAFSGTGLTEVVLPENMDYIGFYAFERCEQLTKVTVLSRDVKFERLVFANGSENLVIHGYSGSTAEAHAQANGITFVELNTEETPEEPEEPAIGETPASSFAYSIANGEVTITSFNGSELDVVIPKKINGYPVTTIGNSAFGGASVKNIVLQDGIKKLEGYNFTWCWQLETITIPASVTEIGNCPFLQSSSDLVIIGAEGSAAEAAAQKYAVDFKDAATGDLTYNGDYGYVIEDGEATLTAYSGTDTELVLPSELGGCPVTVIGMFALMNDSDVTSVTIPEGVTSIRYGAMQYNRALTEVILPESLTSIEGYVFYECESLKEITIPENVISINRDAFVNVPEGFVIKGYAGSYAGSYAEEHGITFIVLDAAGEYTYTVSYDFMAVITGYTGDDAILTMPSELGGYPVGYIDDYAFENNTTLVEVTLPVTLKRIGTGAFGGCTSLRPVKMPQGLKEIADAAFFGCTGTTSVEIPESVTIIGGFAFAECPYLKKAIIPAGVETISTRAFYGAHENFAIFGYPGTTAQTYASQNGHRFVELDEELDTLSYVYAIEYNEAKITDYRGSETGTLRIPSELEGFPVTSVAKSAFYGCEAETIIVPDSMVKLLSYSFAGCENLKSIVIPSSVTGVGACAFLGCNSELIVTGVRGSVMEAYAKKYGVGFKDAETGDLLFDNDYGYEIKNGEATIYAYTGTESVLTLPATLEGYPVTVLSGEALRANDQLTNVTISEGVKKIGGAVLENCFNLKTVTIPASVTEISTNAFAGACEDFTIYGYTGSIAETFANEKGIAFVALD